MNKCYLKIKTALVFCMIFLMFGISFAAIPEPDTIIYGKVTNVYLGYRQMLYSGQLCWKLKDQLGIRSYTYSTVLEPLNNGEYSYRLTIPHETLVNISNGNIPDELYELLLSGSIANTASETETTSQIQIILDALLDSLNGESASDLSNLSSAIESLINSGILDETAVTEALQSLEDGEFLEKLGLSMDDFTQIMGKNPFGNTILLDENKKQFNFAEITLDGMPVKRVKPASEFISASQPERFSRYRIDLEMDVPPTDTDGDGIPDFWETLFGLNPLNPDDTHLDFDSDGLTNREEFLAGSNPLLNNTLPTIMTTSVSSCEGCRSGILLQAMDADSAPDKLVYTLKQAPVGASLYLMGSQDRMLAENDTFTQLDANDGKLYLVHEDITARDISFELVLNDENPLHPSDQKTIPVILFIPSDTDGSDAAIWLDAWYQSTNPPEDSSIYLWNDTADGINQKLSALHDRSGSKAFKIKDSNGNPITAPYHAVMTQPDTPIQLEADALNGKPTVRMDGNDGFQLPYSSVATVFPDTDRIIFGVFKPEGGAHSMLLSAMTFETSVIRTTDLLVGGEFSYTTQNQTIYSHAPVNDRWNLITLFERNDHATMAMHGRWSSGQDMIPSIETLGTDPAIGSKVSRKYDYETNTWKNTYNQVMTGYIAELIAFNKSIPPERRQRIEAYLHSKWFGYQIWDMSDESRGVKVNAPLTGTVPKCILIGGTGDDQLSGGPDDDIIIGNGGANTLIGNGGADVFKFLHTQKTQDTLLDFSPENGDAIDLTDILSGESTLISDYIKLTFDGKDSYIRIDANGDRSGYTDLTICLQNAVYLQENLTNLWANRNLVTGIIRPALNIAIQSNIITAREADETSASFTLSFDGDGLPANFTLPVAVVGSAIKDTDYRIETDIYNTNTGEYESIEVLNHQIPVALKPGDKSVQVRIIPIQDGTGEPDETINITLLPQDRFYDLSEIKQIELTVSDGRDQIRLQNVSSQAYEADGTKGQFLIIRNGSVDRQRIIKLDILGTAINGTDFGYIDKEIILPAGVSELPVYVEPYPDGQPEPTEYLEIIVLPGEDYEPVIGSNRIRIAISDKLILGDIDHLNGINLSDAILALQICSGTPPVRPVYLDADVDDDGKFGIQDAIYILGRIVKGE